GGCHDFVWPYYFSEVRDTVSNQLRVLDYVGGVSNHAWVEQHVVWQRNILPDLPLVGMAWGGRLEGVAAHLSAQDLFQDVAERNAGHVWTVPRAPADMQAGQLLRDILDGFIEHIDALTNETTEILDGRLGVDLVPGFCQIRSVKLNRQASIGDCLVFVRQCCATSLDNFRLSVVVLISQTSSRTWGKRSNKSVGDVVLSHCVFQKLHVCIDFLLANIGDGASEFRVADLRAASEDTGFRIFVCFAEQSAIAAVREGSQSWLTRLGANDFFACPTVNVSHRQPAQAGEGIIPPRAVVHRTRGDVAILAFVDDV